MGKRGEKGFTLIELLVVIAIIGLLASVVLASLDTARKKGRDARRLADMKELSAALELYYSDHVSYIAQTTQANAATALAALAPAYISTIPDDPLGGSYHYVYKTTTGGTYYCLGTILENSANIPPSSCNTTSLGSSLTGVQYSVGP